MGGIFQSKQDNTWHLQSLSKSNNSLLIHLLIQGKGRCIMTRWTVPHCRGVVFSEPRWEKEQLSLLQVLVLFFMFKGWLCPPAQPMASNITKRNDNKGHKCSFYLKVHLSWRNVLRTGMHLVDSTGGWISAATFCFFPFQSTWVNRVKEHLR